MKTTISSQQAAFFSQHGYIELGGIPFQSSDLFTVAQKLAASTPFGRDLWRQEASLRHLLCRTLAPTALSLAAKPLRIGCDQWISFQNGPQKISSCKDLFSIQGLALIALFSFLDLEHPERRESAVGIPPFPLRHDHILFVKPHILLDWPLLSRVKADLYLAAYALAEGAVYIHNPNDPGTHLLKQMGYSFGDVLQNKCHPIVIKSGLSL